MTVISLTVIQSPEQIVSGIPRFLTITANIPCTIFYTTDGTTPTLFSSIYITPIALPTDQLTLTVQIFATDGVNNSPVIIETYQPDIVDGGLRTPHAGTNAPAQSRPKVDPYPFGSPPLSPGQMFLGIGAAGYTTDDPLLPQTPTGFDGAGNPDGYTNEPVIGIPTKTQPILASTTDQEGQSGYGIGTLPKHSVAPVIPPPEYSDVSSKLFDPRALVITFDTTQPQDPGLPPFIVGQQFSLEDVERVRSGNQFYNVGIDHIQPATANFLRQHYNQVDNTFTYYFFDRIMNRWLIQKSAFTGQGITSYSANMVFGNGNKNVFQWVLWKPSYLY